MMVSVEYCHPLVADDGCIQFTNMQLQNNDNLKIIFLIFSQYNTKGSIQLDVILIKSVCTIC